MGKYILNSAGKITGTKINTYIHNSKDTSGKSIAMGIDVSYHNGNIDWNKVKASGVEYALSPCRISWICRWNDCKYRRQ